MIYAGSALRLWQASTSQQCGKQVAASALEIKSVVVQFTEAIMVAPLKSDGSVNMAVMLFFILSFCQLQVHAAFNSFSVVPWFSCELTGSAIERSPILGRCVPGCASACRIYGNHTYAIESQVCGAAIHAGRIGAAGGLVYLNLTAGMEFQRHPDAEATGYTLHEPMPYPSLLRNGITSLEKSASARSFDFLHVSGNVCDAEPIPRNGGASCDRSLQIGSTCDVACDAGFELDGASSLSCGSDAAWSNAVPTCRVQ